MRRFLVSLCVIVACSLIGPAQSAFWIGQTTAPVVGGGTSSCQTLPGLTCDANGFTILTVGPAGFVEGQTACGALSGGNKLNTTCIFYVSTSGNDSNDGTYSSPLLTPGNATHNIMRNNAPDWVLLKCGDVFQNHADGSIQVNGLSLQYPNLVSSYDPNAFSPGVPHAPGVAPVPDPPSCSAQPKMEVDSNWYNGTADPNYQTCVACVTQHLFAPVNFNAFVGLYYWATSRDWTNTSSCAFTCYSPGESQYQMGGAGSGGSTTNGYLLEDSTFAYFNSASGTGRNDWTTYQNGYIRRNQFFGTYRASLTATSTDAVNTSPIPSGPILYDNLIDYDYCPAAFSCFGWGQDTSGVDHLLYESSHNFNGFWAFLALAGPGNIYGNIFSNEGASPQFRIGNLLQENSFIQVPFNIQLATNNTAFASITSDNVIVNAIPSNSVNVAGMILFPFGTDGYLPYFSSANSSVAVTNNYLVNSPASQSFSQALDIMSGWTNATVTGHVTFGFAPGSSNSTTQVQSIGAAQQYTITNPGSGYTDQSATFSGTQSYTTYSGDPSAPNYIVATGITAPNGIPGTGSCAFQVSGHAGVINAVLPASQGGVYTCFNSGGNIVIGESVCDTACTSSETGTLYFPYLTPAVSCVTCTNGISATGATADVISANGNIVFMGVGGADAPTEFINVGGSGYSNGDTVRVTTGTTSGINTGGTTPFPSNTTPFLATVGIAVNTVASAGCNVLTNNITDSEATNACSFTDPFRTAGSYYQTGGSGTWTPTANATFTGSVTAGVLTAGTPSAPLKLGDAIWWSGQTHPDYIKVYSGGVIATLAAPVATPCSTFPSGCSANVFSSVATTTSSSGTGATANVSVDFNGTAGVITGFQLVSQGTGYRLGDTLSLVPSVVGGSGGSTNFSVTITGVTTGVQTVSGLSATPCAVGACVAGTYTNVPLTGGSGGGALATVVVTGTTVTSVTPNASSGNGYVVGNTLSAASTSLGGVGGATNFTVSVASVGGFIFALGTPTATACTGGGCTTNASHTYNGVPLFDADSQGATGTGATANITVTNGKIASVALVSGGSGYYAGEPLTTPMLQGGPSNTRIPYLGGVVTSFDTNGTRAGVQGVTNFTVLPATFTNGSGCGSTCTGSGGAGTYQLTGINSTVSGGTSMSSYTASQLTNLMRKQNKQNWNPLLTACKFNTYIKAGFGYTDTCTP